MDRHILSGAPQVWLSVSVQRGLIMGVLTLLLRQFLSSRQRFEDKAFQIYLAILPSAGMENTEALAKFAIDAALNFDAAIDEATIGLEDLKRGLPH
jgi:hypothetical protein